MSKIAIALSGGVDSGTAAYLLKEQGHNIVGIFMQLWVTSQQSLNAAKQVADFLNIDLHVVDYSKEFKKQVVDYFTNEYRAGRTPNPCVVCNKYIKFGRLLKEAKKLDCEYLATGHYARLESTDRAIKLLKGRDPEKDQSYFLWKLNQQQLEKALFPVGNLLKSEVREIAAANNLPIAKRPDSQKICFIAGDYRDFLKKHIPNAFQPGDVLNTEGEVIGKHFGLPLYTIGQRRGFQTKSAVPLYVTGIDIKNNRLIVGRDQESERKSFSVTDINWVNPALKKEPQLNCEVQIRYRGPIVKAAVERKTENRLKVKLENPLRSVTPGQSAVFYNGRVVLGGGVISS